MSKIMFMDNEYSGNYVGLIDFFYPIGSYYETSDTSFNPNTTWGGTWVLEEAGQVHVSAGTGYEVSGANDASGAGNSDGGGTTKSYTPAGTIGGTTLTDQQIAHGHGFTQPNIPNHTHVHGDWYVSATKDGGGGSSRWTLHALDTSGSSKFAVKTNATGNPSSLPACTGGSVWNLHGASNTRTSHNHTWTGTATNINVMQPYIIVNRWHRTA